MVAGFHPHSWWAELAPVPHGVRPKGCCHLAVGLVPEGVDPA